MNVVGATPRQARFSLLADPRKPRADSVHSLLFSVRFLQFFCMSISSDLWSVHFIDASFCSKATLLLLPLMEGEVTR